VLGAVPVLADPVAWRRSGIGGLGDRVRAACVHLVRAWHRRGTAAGAARAGGDRLIECAPTYGSLADGFYFAGYDVVRERFRALLGQARA